MPPGPQRLVNMEKIPPSPPGTNRFDETVYDAATQHQLDPIPLLFALESSRTIACGVSTLLGLLREHAIPELPGETPTLIHPQKTDELLSLCIESMSLLNTRIEHLADQMSQQLQGLVDRKDIPTTANTVDGQS